MAHQNFAAPVHQGLLLDQLKCLFPDKEIYQNARKDSNVKYGDTGAYLELDLWIPAVDLCFEFQDSYHYIPAWYTQSSKQYISHQDTTKDILVRQNNITFVTVPCWWDGSAESLGATIQFHRPDLVTGFDVHPTISLIPPQDFFPLEGIPNVGELMLASFPVDPKFNNPAVDSAWWMGEKYDGIRICWHPSHKLAYGRSGRQFPLVTPMAASLPTVFIDGELWFGRGQFSLIYALVHGINEEVHWHNARFAAFDVPLKQFHKKPFEERYAVLLSNIFPDSPITIVASRMLYVDNLQLKYIVECTVDNEGEGIILRQVGSLYEPGRSPFLLKLKTSYGDAEAIVIQKGPNNSVTIGLPSGKVVVVPPANVEIPSPEIGAIVTFSYEKHSQKDILQNPKIYRLRHDLSWQDVLRNSHKDRRYLSSYSYSKSFNVHPLDQKMTFRMRTYIEEFAKSRNLNPSLPQTLVAISYEALNMFQSGKTILHKFNGSYFQTLKYLFPEVALEQADFPEVEKRRNFFEKYAKIHGFDPLVPDNWYSQSRKSILAMEGARRILFFHGNSIAKALQDLFPTIGLDKSKFPSLPMWRNSKNRRRFFVEYAKENSFDSLNPENWYLQSFANIKNRKGASRVLFYHNASVSKALLDLFPNIGLRVERFSKPPKWSEKINRRNFFEQYAMENGFDPHVPEHWYQQSREKLMSIKGAAGVVVYHQHDVAKALLDLFPDIGLDSTKLRNEWDLKLQTKKERLGFFENYARFRGFDAHVPENWYVQSKRDFALLKNSHKMTYHKIMFYYNHNLANALVDLFPYMRLDSSKLKNV
eukprot:Phypoly_transcript_03072.p1 GENE.Phypoly_transcript_03072~~Phypoly_transcript_03072.p1  ORF type:complete len:815 (+),score=91.36 Phypoly_transcript_03072:101-2545(+)